MPPQTVNVPAPSAPITPNAATPAAPNLNALPGETVAQYEARLGAMSGARGSGAGFGTPVTPRPVTDTSSAQDEVAKQFGFNSYAEAVQALGGDGKSTTDFYNDAYKTAGLDALANEIASRKNDLATATGKINDNPWLDEANRVGRIRNLQTLANADIKNLNDEYSTKLKSVHDLVSQHNTDVANNQKKLAFLESSAKALASEAATKAKNESAPPKTIKAANGATYKWNPATNSFDPLFPGKASSTKSASDFQFSPKQLLSLQTRGLPQDAANNILTGIKQGIPFDQIRQNLRDAGYDPAVLDEIMYYVDPKHNTPSKQNAAPTTIPGVSLNTGSTAPFA